MASAVRDVTLDPDAVFIGEVGLGGEIRPVRQVERRLSEADRLGFRRAYLARSSEAPIANTALEIAAVGDVAGLVDELFG